MSLLSPAIRFRLLVDQLDDKEFRRFIDELLQKYGRAILLSSLFQMFAGAEPKSFGPNVLDDTISIIKSIMKGRKKTSDSEGGPPTLSSLSCELIGEIGSYCKKQVSLFQDILCHFCCPYFQCIVYRNTSRSVNVVGQCILQTTTHIH